MKRSIYLYSSIIFITLLLIFITSCKKSYTVKFMVDEIVIKEVTLEKGEAAIAPVATKEGYTFKRWDQDFSSVTEDLIVKAIFEINQYKVTFKIDEQILEEKQVTHGSDVTPPTAPIKEGLEFMCWDQDLNNITKDLEVNAVYETKKYTVTFIVDGQLYKEVEVEHGSSCEKPTSPTKIGHIFKAWDQDFTNVTDNLIINATFDKRSYKVTFVNLHGDVIGEQQVLYEESAIAPTNVEVEGYEFVEWDCDFSSIKTNIIVVGIYNKVVGYIKYYDGKELLDLNPASYKVNDVVELPVLEKEGYAFLGWYLAEISLTQYTTLPTDQLYDFDLYAKFVEIEKQNPIVLPDAKYHFTGTNYGTTWQPVLPSEAPTGVTNYTWTTSDSSIATISMWSSITKKQNGYCVITATHNTDPSIVINGVFKLSADGIELSSVEEANKIEIVNVTFVGKDNEILNTVICQKGGWAIPPLAPIYEGFVFTGWDKDYYNITEDTVIKATYKEGTSGYEGKTFGIIGDSISTCSGYIPEGFASFYPYPTADVDLPLTWWMRTITALGGTLLINNSYSGTCVSSGNSNDTKNMSRLEHLVINGEAPDVILIYMGSNDCASSYVTVGQFDTGYKEMIDNLQTLCPNSEIVLCTLATSPFYTVTNQISYNEVIKKYASEYNLKLVDLASVSLEGHLVDSAHPGSTGMELIANEIIDELAG